jgi:putative FmdB family regulatory protein
MPLYEYYCERCDKVFEALRPLRESELPAPCPDCGRDGERIMPTSFSAMSWNKGYPQRVPFHQRPVRTLKPKRAAVAPVRPKAAGKAKTKAAKK